MKKVIADTLASGGHEINFGDVNVSILTHEYDASSFQRGKDRFFMAKSPAYITGYDAIAQSTPVKSVLELGIYMGGSVVFLDQMLDLDRLVAVDLLTDRLPDLDDYVERHARADIGLHYGVDQADHAALADIVARSFPDGIDLVIDDASHFLGPSRSSFETLFPLMNPGGVYVVEDWSWAHTSPKAGPGHEDCTILLHEIIDLHSSGSGAAPYVKLQPGFFSVMRGHEILPTDFKLSDYRMKAG